MIEDFIKCLTEDLTNPPNKNYRPIKMRTNKTIQASKLFIPALKLSVCLILGYLGLRT